MNGNFSVNFNVNVGAAGANDRGGWGGQDQLLQRFGDQNRAQGGMDPYLQHAQGMCGQRGLEQLKQQLLMMLTFIMLLQKLMEQVKGGDTFDKGQPAGPAPDLQGKENGGWLAPHGGYEKTGEGTYKINQGEYAGCTAVSQGNGKFNVFDASGSMKGTFTSPGNQDKIASPLTFDLNGDGKVGTTSKDGGRRFDLDGDGKVDQTAWAGKGDGVLTFDRDGDGVSGADGRELLGNNTDVDGDGKADGYANGFQALRALAEKHLGKEATADGKLDAKELKALEEKTGLRMNVDGQSKKLSELGISAIDLGFREAGANADANGNEHRQLGSFTMNGQARQVNDVWFRYGQG